jgi:hypothetical protein
MQFSDSTAGRAPTIPYCAEVPSAQLHTRTLTDYLRHFGRRDDNYRKDEGKRTIAIVLMVIGGLAVLLGLVCFGAAIIAGGGTIMATLYTLFGVACTIVGLLIGVPGIYMYNRYHKKLKRAKRAEAGLQ